jgi:hypothetical protein
MIGGVQPQYQLVPQQNSLNGRFKILVILRQSQVTNKEYKKMMVVMNGSDKIYTLKRAIDKEVMDLFPMEQPYVVAKIEDASGYSLSNQSYVQDFITQGMTVYALPEQLLDPSQEMGTGGGGFENVHLHAGQNITELVQMLSSLQHNILKKMATSGDLNRSSALPETQLKQMFQAILPLGFSKDRQHIQNLSLVLNKCLQRMENVRVFDAHPHLADLIISVISFWLSE